MGLVRRRFGPPFGRRPSGLHCMGCSQHQGRRFAGRPMPSPQSASAAGGVLFDQPHRAEASPCSRSAPIPPRPLALKGQGGAARRVAGVQGLRACRPFSPAPLPGERGVAPDASRAAALSGGGRVLALRAAGRTTPPSALDPSFAPPPDLPTAEGFRDDSRNRRGTACAPDAGWTPRPPPRPSPPGRPRPDRGPCWAAQAGGASAPGAYGEGEPAASAAGGGRSPPQGGRTRAGAKRRRTGGGHPPAR